MLCQEATIKQRSDQRLISRLIALIRKRSPDDIKSWSPSEEILINWRPRCFLWKAVESHPSSQKYTLNDTLNKSCSQHLGFVFFSNTFIIDFSLEELNTANISFYEMSIL